MRCIHDRWQADRPAPVRLVFLPPAQATLEDLLTHGFVQAVRTRQLAVDVTLVETDYQQVLAGTVAADLQRDVMLPMLAADPTPIWMAGISLGAFNILHHASHYPDHLAGLVLLAPYPGTADILNEIEAGGGPARWARQPDVSLPDERRWWHWLATRGPVPEVHLGLSAEDRFRHGQAMLATLVAEEQTLRLPGTHQWPVWQTLWQQWLDRGHWPSASTIEVTP
ncbi:alpha/beta hydrolase [Leeia oryzae]|uniref:alpha/beta hydrolase n=1 Tax=Leeia oryzae TaxID=356662 RepID=UPI00036B2150|nr:alpha/beta hydrolase [Leeia oryzae]